jgi:hypothetical protein
VSETENDGVRTLTTTSWTLLKENNTYSVWLRMWNGGPAYTALPVGQTPNKNDGGHPSIEAALSAYRVGRVRRSDKERTEHTITLITRLGVGDSQYGQAWKNFCSNLLREISSCFGSMSIFETPCLLPWSQPKRNFLES